MKNYIFGIDVGGTTVKMGIFTKEGTLIHKWEIITRKEEGGKYILTDIANSCMDVAKEQGFKISEFIGIGMGIPGAVDKTGIVHGCVNLEWGLGDIDVKSKMEKLTGLTTKVANDANVAALGEMWVGAGKGYDDVAMLTLGTGVGGGIISNGNLIIGGHGYGAEIGHMRINMHEKNARCNCGKMGCLEQYCSATGIRNEAVKALEASDTPSVLRNMDQITAKSVFDAAKASDALAIGLVEKFGCRLAKGISYISCITDPDIFIIGGGVSNAGNIILDVVKRFYPSFVYGRQKEAEFVLAKLGNDAGIYGAAKLLL